VNPFKKGEIGSTGIYVTRCGLGVRGIVDPNVVVSDARARDTVETLFNVGVNYIDTSPRYGLGRSEEFVSQVVSRKDRDSFVLSIKAGRLLDLVAKGGWYWNFSADGVLRSLQSSLERMNLDYV
jgi:D-threo-aldose 1-dehydrogenase